jgi:regulatory protein YycH of two-component signal transduction system YycFG
MQNKFSNLFIINIDDASAIRLLILVNIVLLSIVLLYFVFRVVIPRIKKYGSELKEKRSIEAETGKSSEVRTPDTEAAIALALYMYFNEMHDEESDIITVKRVSKTYSPWSSKLYSMRNLRIK